MQKPLTIKDFKIKGKKILLRTDYNVPINQKGDITDDFRIKASLPTIKLLIKEGATQIIIATHLGRPKNKEEIYTTNKIAKRIYKLTGRKTTKVDDSVDFDEFPTPREAKIVLLENLRFREEEKLNDKEYAKKLAKLADIYINDAFGVSHREHASVHAITKYIPGGIGLLVEKELNIFKELEKPEKPFTAIIGGSKLETKLPLIMNLIHKVDHLLLGGAMIFTFYKAKGYSIGKSMYDKKYVMNAKLLGNNEKITLPKDVVVADDKDNPSTIITMQPKNIPSYLTGLDLGKETIEEFKKILGNSKTMIWNGPLGYYENPEFLKATKKILQYLANRKDIKTIIGGGDTASIAEQLKIQNEFYHVSTGGGASLTLMEGKQLTAIQALIKSPKNKK
ncbi:phosphoglycerate kinase [Candidatus Woesearchaeota archaeon]|nr:phosphoglycerate kinase [Candidatus Woesearchaeota archaeon]